MTWSAAAVAELRSAFRMSRAEFASLIGVDTRSVSRWESDIARPTGAPKAVLVALREKLARSGAERDLFIDYVRKASGVGGLSYFLVRLLDDALQSERVARSLDHPPRKAHHAQEERAAKDPRRLASEAEEG